MTTNVVQSGVIPALKSTLGKVRGGRSKVITWFTRPTASSLIGRSKTRRSKAHCQAAAVPPPRRIASTERVKSTTSSATIDPK